MYANATKRRNRNHDAVMASQIDFARQQKNKIDLDTLEKSFPPEKLLNVTEAVKYLGRGDTYLSNLNTRGRGPKRITKNGRAFYSKKDLDAFLDKRKEKESAKKCKNDGYNCINEPYLNCVQCGKQIPKRNHYPSQYKRRKFCNSSCAAAHRFENMKTLVGRSEKHPPKKSKPTTTKPVELTAVTPTNNWKHIKRGLEIAGTKPDTISKLEIVYNLGFEDGSAK